MAATQTSLLALLDTVQAVPRTRTSHPVSSERAEIRARESGVMRGQALIVLGLVKSVPGRTSKELAAVDSFMRGKCGLDRYQIARRLPELLSAKLVRRTDEQTESRWWPI